MFHWCNFCRTRHSSPSCYHPGNPLNKRGGMVVAERSGICRDDIELEYAPKGTTERLKEAESLLNHVLSPEFYSKGRIHRDKPILKFLGLDEGGG